MSEHPNEPMAFHDDCRVRMFSLNPRLGEVLITNGETVMTLTGKPAEMVWSLAQTFAANVGEVDAGELKVLTARPDPPPSLDSVFKETLAEMAINLRGLAVSLEELLATEKHTHDSG